MKTIVGFAAALGAIALAGYAGAVLLGAGPQLAVLEELLGGDAPAPESDAEARHRRERLGALARGLATPKESVFEDEEEAAPMTSPGVSISRDEARAGFDYVMRRVEKLARKRRRLDPEQWQETWRTANDAYTALSMQLDANDRSDLAELDEAHHRLKQGLRRVRVKGGKFKYE